MRILILFFPFIYLFSANLEFSLYKKEGEKKGNTLFVIGGIHGNEPGGYFAAAFLEKYYKIQKGNLWIIPNLNFDSIVLSRRGIYGDMNRKFSSIEKNDADYEIVKKVKKLILDEKVDLILNLHDGFGFYRKKYENAIFNPNAWGQATIIDQKKIHGLDKFGDLDKIASKVNNNLNEDKLFENYHSFGVKNTQTKFKDEQQQLSLTYFAVTNDKPAFAIETSKNITDLTQKVIYQLKSIEEFMNIMGIKFERKFEMNNYTDVKSKVYNFGKVKINDNITLTLNEIKNTLRFIPLKDKNNNIKFTHSLGAYRYNKRDKIFEFYIGNIKICNLYPQYFEIKNTNEKIKLIVDGKEKEISLGEEISLKNSFKILKSSFRVNVIGFSKSDLQSEDEILIEKNDIVKKYSLDNKNEKYRVEFYKNGKFYGMITLNFENKKKEI